MSVWRTLYVFENTDSDLRLPGTPTIHPDEPNADTFTSLQGYFDVCFDYYFDAFTNSLTPALTPMLNVEVPQAEGYPYGAVAERTAVLVRRLRALFPWWKPAVYGLHVQDPYAPFQEPTTPAFLKNSACEPHIRHLLDRVDIDCYPKWSGSGPLRYGYDPAQKLDDAYSWALYTYTNIVDAYNRYGPVRGHFSPGLVAAPSMKRVSLTTWNFMLANMRQWARQGLLSEIVLFDGWTGTDEEDWSVVKNQTTTSLSGHSVKAYTDAAYTYATANP